MIENFKISARQFMILVLLYSVGTVILHTPAPLAGYAKQDAWLSSTLGACIGLTFVWLYIRIGRLYPDITLDQVIEKVFGRWIGKAVNFTLFFWAFSTAAEIIFYVGDFIKIFWMPETPIAMLNILFILIVVMAVRLGIETFTRSVEILFIPFILLLIILILTILPHADVHNIQPVLEEGFKPVIQATFFYVSVFSMSPIMFLMIFPSKINQRSQGEKAFYMGTLIGGIILVIVILLNLLVLGPNLTANNIAPSYVLAKKINIGNFIMRIEAVLAVTWVITTYIRAVVYFYVSVVVFANLFNIKDHHPFATPLGMMMTLLSLIVYPNVQVVMEYNKEIWMFYAATFGLVLPILLLSVTKIKKVIKKRHQSENQIY
ncbi:spore germination protein KB [Bacillus pakistanensis]|uniref:Spore germination protein KB n=1 Tax=Rossellomorea pakistanensis TaxID=992288 RepID=A0ABS2NCT7_9BACI|nr:endospore germination permease [Bacillus pakistanensis]MBM7585625.1 spore germination protein KB [Bacillus pakistanensis]